jgi:TPR repeat protein
LYGAAAGIFQICWAMFPQQAQLGLMYADGKGVQQNYVEAGKWWAKAAEGGHVLAAANAARCPKVPVPGAIR